MNAPSPQTPSPTTLAQLFREVAQRFSDRPAFIPRNGSGHCEPVSYHRLYQRALDLATGLTTLGLHPRAHVALIADNRFEWILCDMAILLSGAADVPRGTDTTDRELLHIINHSDAQLVILENDELFNRYLKLRPQLLNTTPVVLISSTHTTLPDQVFTLETLETQGRAIRASGDSSIEDGIDAIAPEDLFTLIYTSGTTGTPKGVQLTHANMISQIRNIPLRFEPTDRVLSILPVWHSYERVFEMMAIAGGACTAYTSLRTLAQDLQTIRPTLMGSAPRLWEGLYAKIQKNVAASSPVKRSLFHLAYTFSLWFQGSRYFLKNRVLLLENPKPARRALGMALHGLRWLATAIPCAILDALVMKKIRAIIGGAFRGTVSGGGALPPHIDAFFNYIGIPVYEGYGMTETSPVSAVRSHRNLIIGTVGPMIPETEVRIVDLEDKQILYPNPNLPHEGRGLKGEIHVKGPQVMRGYYKDVRETERVLQEGWMNTGDIGMVTFNNCLKILGRSKDTIVLSSGENVEPLPIESKLLESPLVEQCMVVGQDEKQLGILIVPNAEELASRLGLQETDLALLIGADDALPLIQREIKLYLNTANGFRSWEQPHHTALLARPFQLGDEMTHTFKLKRHVIAEKYADTIYRFYRH